MMPGQPQHVIQRGNNRDVTFAADDDYLFFLDRLRQSSDLCDEHEMHPNVFYRWQCQFFEGGAAAFEQESSRELGRLKRQVAALEERLARKDAALAEITEEYVRCKKKTMDSFKETMGAQRRARCDRGVYQPLCR
jgi:transposase